MEDNEQFQSHEFKCDLSNSVIEYRCNKEGDAFMEYTYINPQFSKSFFVLLRTSIEFLKNKKCKKIVQTVVEDDWNKFLSKNEKWKIRSKMTHNGNNFLVIECKIKNALYCISDGLGVNSN